MMVAKYLSAMWTRDCAGRGKSFVAVDVVCGGGGIVDIDAAEESGAGAVLDLDGGVAEVVDAVFVIGCSWREAWMVARLGWS